MGRWLWCCRGSATWYFQWLKGAKPGSEVQGRAKREGLQMSSRGHGLGAQRHHFAARIPERYFSVVCADEGKGLLSSAQCWPMPKRWAGGRRDSSFASIRAVRVFCNAVGQAPCCEEVHHGIMI